MDVLEANKRDFIAMVALYNTIQNIKNIFVPKLEAGERFRTYYYDEKTGTYEVGNQEGYVAIRESTNAVKFLLGVDLILQQSVTKNLLKKLLRLLTEMTTSFILLILRRDQRILSHQIRKWSG